MIYTKTGDKGETSLASGQRVAKTDARIEAYGTADELNSWIGLLRAEILNHKFEIINHQSSVLDDQLLWLQNRLFDLGAYLSEAPGEWIAAEDVRQLEQWIDTMQEVVPKQRAFVLPAGSETVCRCHVCRTVCRRLERRILALQNVSPEALQFVNRLSDYLFVLARLVGYKLGEKEENWQKK